MQALKMLAMTYKAFPSDPALMAGARVVREMSTRHADLISGARTALDAHAFLEARQQVQANVCF